MVVTCDIEFENNAQAVYYAGQVITGKVTLTADKIKQVEAVNLKILGSANTRWKENRSDTIYYGQVDYINTVTPLLAPKATDEAVYIEPGIHTFSFACHIPLNCPSSFEGDHGYIRYVLQVTLLRPWKYDQKYTKGFTVLKIMNLNYDSPMLKLPTKDDITKHFCYGPCSSDPLQINVQLPQTGYVPGQNIPLSIMVANNTVTSINEIVASLVMNITYLSEIPKNSTSQTTTVSKFTGDSVLRNCKKNFNYLLPIPATPPTCTTLCSIIHITYRVEVEVKIQSILYPNQHIHTPVTIGNVPLQMEGTVIQQQPLPKQLNLEEVTKSVDRVDSGYNPTISDENIEPWSAFDNMPAPVYLEATHMSKGTLTEDTEHEYGEKYFTPKYPIFNVRTPTSMFPTNDDDIDGHSANPSMVTDPNKSTWL